MKQKKKNSILEQVKAARKQNREEEIQTHGKTINYRKVMESKKQYNRKINKADDEVLPYLFTFVPIYLHYHFFYDMHRAIKPAITYIHYGILCLSFCKYLINNGMFCTCGCIYNITPT
jgi:hypothetical protein